MRDHCEILTLQQWPASQVICLREEDRQYQTTSNPDTLVSLRSSIHQQASMDSKVLEHERDNNGIKEE